MPFFKIVSCKLYSISFLPTISSLRTNMSPYSSMFQVSRFNTSFSKAVILLSKSLMISTKLHFSRFKWPILTSCSLTRTYCLLISMSLYAISLRADSYFFYDLSNYLSDYISFNLLCKFSTHCLVVISFKLTLIKILLCLTQQLCELYYFLFVLELQLSCQLFWIACFNTC